MKREAVFCTEIVASLRQAGAWAHKIADTPVVSGGRFAHPKPFDIIGAFADPADGLGVPLAFEVKWIKGFKALHRNMLEPSQHVELPAFEVAGGLSFVAVVVWIPRKLRALYLWRYHEFHGWHAKDWAAGQFPAIVAHSEQQANRSRRHRYDLHRWLRTHVSRIG